MDVGAMRRRLDSEKEMNAKIASKRFYQTHSNRRKKKFHLLTDKIFQNYLLQWQ